MKKNVWLLNHYASDTYIDEGGRHYWIGEYLRKENYNPVVFAANSIHRKEGHYFKNDALFSVHRAEKIDVPYVFVKVRSYRGNGITRVLNMVDFYFHVITAAKKYAKQTQERPNVIVASSVHPLTVLAGIKLAKFFGVKCICEIRDLWPESIVAYGLLRGNGILARLLYRGEKYLYKRSDAVVMTWKGGYQYIKDKGWDNEIPQSKVFYISNGVDLPSFDENKTQNAYSLHTEKNEKLFVYTGSIRKVNHLGLLVAAAKKLSAINTDAKILVFGDGDEKEPLENQVSREGLSNIVFMGRVEKSKIPCILSQCYATILHNSSTSLDQYGQSQNKLFEYLAAGRPVLMTYSVGYSIVKDGNCGLELAHQDPDSIAEAIDFMCKMPQDTYAAYCENARELSKKYDFHNLTQQLINIIEEHEQTASES